MFGFINNIKYLSNDFSVDTANDLQTLIFMRRYDNLQFYNSGESIVKFVYFDETEKEYNYIALYNTEQEIIDQHIDYLNNYKSPVAHTTFPSEYIISKYGPLNEFKVLIRPIEIPDNLIRQMKTSIYLGNLKFVDESKFDDMPKNTLEEFNSIYDTYNVNNIYTQWPEDFSNYQEFENYHCEYYGISLNVIGDDISEQVGWGLNYYEDELKQIIAQSKTNKFSDDFFAAISNLVEVDYSFF